METYYDDSGIQLTAFNKLSMVCNVSGLAAEKSRNPPKQDVSDVLSQARQLHNAAVKGGADSCPSPVRMRRGAHRDLTTSYYALDAEVEEGLKNEVDELVTRVKSYTTLGNPPNMDKDRDPVEHALQELDEEGGVGQNLLITRIINAIKGSKDKGKGSSKSCKLNKMHASVSTSQANPNSKSCPQLPPISKTPVPTCDLPTSALVMDCEISEDSWMPGAASPKLMASPLSRNSMGDPFGSGSGRLPIIHSSSQSSSGLSRMHPPQAHDQPHSLSGSLMGSGRKPSIFDEGLGLGSPNGFHAKPSPSFSMGSSTGSSRDALNAGSRAGVGHGSGEIPSWLTTASSSAGGGPLSRPSVLQSLSHDSKSGRGCGGDGSGDDQDAFMPCTRGKSFTEMMALISSKRHQHNDTPLSPHPPQGGAPENGRPYGSRLVTPSVSDWAPPPGVLGDGDGGVVGRSGKSFSNRPMVGVPGRGRANTTRQELLGSVGGFGRGLRG